MDICHDRVQKFDSSGKFLLMFGGHVNETTGGNVCVLGEACTLGAEGTADGEFEWAAGSNNIAVGPGGDVYVGDKARVQVFEPSGAWKESVSLAGLPSTAKVTGLAIDAMGDMFVVDEGVAGVRELEPDGVEKATQFDAGSTVVEAIALDDAGDLFVADSTGGFHVLKYDPVGKELASFGSNAVTGTKGIVFSDALNELYVSAGESVSILASPPSGPWVEPESESGTPGFRGAATFEAIVNPEGSSTSYHFEYVDDAQFKASGFASASSTAVTSIGSSFEDQHAEASLPVKTLIPGMTYHWRVVIGVSVPIIVNASPHKSIPYPVTEALYSLEPNVGEPARFGFQTLAGPVILDTSVRTGGGYGVVVTVSNIVDLTLLGSQLTFWGDPADHRHDISRGRECIHHTEPQEFGGEELSCSANEKTQPFLIMPTSCTGLLHTTMEADSWSAPGAFGTPIEYTFQNGAGGIGEPYGLDGCNRLSFEPSISVAPDGQQGSTPTGLTVDVHVPQEASLNPTGLADSTREGHDCRRCRRVLRSTLLVRMACRRAVRRRSAWKVQANRRVLNRRRSGRWKSIRRCCRNPLVGAAYLAEQDANPFGSLVAMYIVVYDPISGVRIKVAGEVKPDPVTGQLVSTFKNTPELPFEELSLHFFGGSRAPLGTPALCGGYTTTASIAPWSGNDPVDSSSEFKITSGPNGSAVQQPVAVRSVAYDGELEYSGWCVHAVHDDDVPRRRQPEPGCDSTEDAPRTVGDAIQRQVVRGSRS